MTLDSFIFWWGAHPILVIGTVCGLGFAILALTVAATAPPPGATPQERYPSPINVRRVPLRPYDWQVDGEAT